MNTDSLRRRVAMVAACPFPSTRGSQVLIRELAEALAERGHEVHVVTYPFAESFVSIRGILLHRIRFSPLTRRRNKLGWRKILLDLALVAKLYRVARAQRIDIIHAHNYEGLVVGLFVRCLTGIPVVYHSHNALSDELGYYFRPGIRRTAASCIGGVLDRLIPRRADFSIALTPALENFLHGRGVAASRLAVVAPGGSPVAPPQLPRTDPFAGRFVVMYTGNLDPYQDLPVLFDAFAGFSDPTKAALLVVVTHDPEWSENSDERLRSLLREGRAQVVVASAFSVVRRLLARADILICPRSSWSGFPIKLINYMAAGKPVIVAEGSAKNIRHGQTGLTFPNGDAAALSAALERLSQDAALRRRLGEAARMTVAQLYSWQRAASDIEQIYAQVAGPAPAGAGLWWAHPGRQTGIDSLRQRSYKRRERRSAV
jgi:1,2-diacylglycerol 3-alpha-glucosyltransferase